MALAPVTFTDGVGYENFMGQWSRAAGRQFLDWLAVPKGLKWLDVGCGTGAFTETIQQKCAPAEIIGIDPSEAQITYARSLYSNGPMIFEVRDARILGFPDHRFDVAASALVLNFISDREKAVAEMRRVVRPNGTVAAYVWDFAGGRGNLEPLRSALLKVTGAKPAAALHAESTTIDSLRKLFEASGLSEVETRAIDIKITYPDFESYWNSNTGFVGPMVTAIRALDDVKQREIKQVAREMLPVDAEGRVSYSATVNAVKGLA